MQIFPQLFKKNTLFNKEHITLLSHHKSNIFFPKFQIFLVKFFKKMQKKREGETRPL